MRRVASALTVSLVALASPARAASDAADATNNAAWRTSGKVEGGYELGAMYARGMHGGRLRLGFGSENDHQAVWATVSGRYGWTFVGLPTWDLRLGADSELLRIGIFHAGAGADLGIHGFTTRATYDISNYDDPSIQYALSFGLSARAGVDVMRWGESKRRAVTLDGRLDAHLFLFGYYGSVGVFVGLRL